MDRSSRLALPFLMPSQAQKHVTHNSALERLDVLVQLVVEAFDAEIPPVAPEDGQIWALGANPTQEWAGEGDTLAARINGAWQFLAPTEGWLAVGRPDGDLRLRRTDGWAVPALPDLQNLEGLGVGTSHDAINRVSVSSPATLLSHAGAGHQLKINKNAASNTASLLFQTDWSGRAEMGTAGDDDFVIKVSPDGSGFLTGLRLDRNSGTAAVLGGLTIGGAEAYHRDNLVGPVTQSDNMPTGAVIERGSTANAGYTRWADGTQICWIYAFNMGSILAAGSGTWASPYRTNSISVIWPVAFSSIPVASATLVPSISSVPLDARSMVLNAFSAPETTGWNFLRAARVGGDAFDMDVLLSVLAVGRWF